MTLVPLSPVDTLTPAMREIAVSTYLEHAKEWLASAVEMTGPEQIAAAKAEIATAAEATKQLHLSKEIQTDALEMVRRAEWALNRSIRRGQAEGEIMTMAEAKSHAGKVRQHGVTYAEQNPPKARPIDFMERHEWNNSQGGISDLDVEAETFEKVIDEAKSEGNLSRANVVRKIRSQASPTTRDSRADLIVELAAQGYSSRQMPNKIGVSEETVRQIARDFNIDIPADKFVGRTRRHDSNRIASETVAALEGLAMGVDLIHYADLNGAEKAHWADSLTHSLRALNRFAKKIKETTQ